MKLKRKFAGYYSNLGKGYEEIIIRRTDKVHAYLGKWEMIRNNGEIRNYRNTKKELEELL